MLHGPCAASQHLLEWSCLCTWAHPYFTRCHTAGPTGYIGKFVVKELVKRGFDVIAFSREKAGIKGKMGKEDVQKVCGGGRTRGEG